MTHSQDSPTPKVRGLQVDKLSDLLWKFGVWDDLTHDQHLELERLVVSARLDEVTNIYKYAVKNNLAGNVKWQMSDRMDELAKKVSDMKPSDQDSPLRPSKSPKEGNRRND